VGPGAASMFIPAVPAVALRLPGVAAQHQHAPPPARCHWDIGGRATMSRQIECLRVRTIRMAIFDAVPNGRLLTIATPGVGPARCSSDVG
jgi:hypothetical protein